jgi:hypothetical protein
VVLVEKMMNVTKAIATILAPRNGVDDARISVEPNELGIPSWNVAVRGEPFVGKRRDDSAHERLLERESFDDAKAKLSETLAAIIDPAIPGRLRTRLLLRRLQGKNVIQAWSAAGQLIDGVLDAAEGIGHVIDALTRLRDRLGDEGRTLGGTWSRSKWRCRIALRASENISRHLCGTFLSDESDVALAQEQFVAIAAAAAILHDVPPDEAKFGFREMEPELEDLSAMADAALRAIEARRVANSPSKEKAS